MLANPENFAIHYDSLPACEQQMLCQWLDAHIEPQGDVNEELTSLALTILYNEATGKVVTNGQVKGAMMALGYRPAYGIRDERYRIHRKG